MMRKRRPLPQPRRVPRTGDWLSVDTFRPRPGQMVPDGGVPLPDFNPMPPPAAPWAQAPGFYESDMIGRGPGPDGGPMPFRPPTHPAFPPGGFDLGPTQPLPFLPNFQGPSRPTIPPGLLEMFAQKATPPFFGGGRGPRRPKRRFGAY